jgi:hypothetical protein
MGGGGKWLNMIATFISAVAAGGQYQLVHSDVAIQHDKPIFIVKRKYEIKLQQER